MEALTKNRENVRRSSVSGYLKETKTARPHRSVKKVSTRADLNMMKITNPSTSGSVVKSVSVKRTRTSKNNNTSYQKTRQNIGSYERPEGEEKNLQVAQTFHEY